MSRGFVEAGQRRFLLGFPQVVEKDSNCLPDPGEDWKAKFVIVAGLLKLRVEMRWTASRDPEVGAAWTLPLAWLRCPGCHHGAACSRNEPRGARAR